MNKIISFSNRLIVAGLCLALCVWSASAQSGRINNYSKSKPSGASPTATAGVQTASAAKPIPLFARTEYIAPERIDYLLNKLKEAGRRGFRLDKITACPSPYISGTSREKARVVPLSATVKYANGQKYDYDAFYAEDQTDPAMKLNLMASNGWYFRDVISVWSDPPGNRDVLIRGKLKRVGTPTSNITTFGNIYLVERISSEPVNKFYQLLKVGIGPGRTPTADMQGLLDKAIADGYVPVATTQTFGATSPLTLDAYCAVLLQMIPDDKHSVNDGQAEFRFFHGIYRSSMQAKVEEAAKEGFNIYTVNFNTVIMMRPNKNETRPVALRFVRVDEPDAAALLKNADNKLDYRIGGIGSFGFWASADLVKNVLIFETTNVTSKEFQTLVVTPKKKNKNQFAGLPENPSDAFKRMLSENFVVRDLFYSRLEGVTVLFERAK